MNTPGSSVLHLTAETFEAQVLNSNQPVLVDFWAPWCGPCRIIGPIVESLATEFTDQLKVAKLNIDHYPEIASHYGVQAIPTLVVFQNGQTIAQMVGVTPKAELTHRLQNLLQQQAA